jgi:hypothetical protein
VMRFADDGARGSALGTAVGTAVPLAEGMVAYLDDVNYVQVYNGSAWTSAIPGIGSNIVQTVKTEVFSASLAAGAVSGDAMTASITPTSDTSKVLVLVTVGVSSAGVPVAAIYRDGSIIDAFTGDGVGSRVRRTIGASGITRAGASLAFAALDSPASASAVTYSIRLGHGSVDTQSVFLNRGSVDDNVSATARTASTITLIEVAA